MTDSETNALAIRMRGVERWFGETHALAGLDLDVPTGALLTLLGPSGSGKTTALRLIAGFDRPDAGTIEVNGRQVVDPPSSCPPKSVAWGWFSRTMRSSRT